MMKKFILILFLTGIFYGCNSSSDKLPQKKKILDSLSIKKEAKLKEIKRLKAEIDSLKKSKENLK